MIRRWLVCLALVGVAAPATAQSLFGLRGLGVPVDPIDARSRALGSVGTGLIGLNTSLVNPADLGGIRRRGVTAMLQPFFGTDELEGRTDAVESTRFPLIHLMYPAQTRLTLGLGYGGFLEHSFAVTADRNEVIGGIPVTTQERISAVGTVAQVRLTAAYELSSAVSLGGAVGIYTGELRRQIVRIFPDTLIFVPFQRLEDWKYQGFLTSVGVRVDLTNSTRFGAAITWNTDLRADPDSGNVVGRTYDMPLRITAGASTIIAPRLLLTAGGQFTGWSDSGNFATPDIPDSTRVSGRPVFEVGGGLEWEQLRTGTRIFPLRVGYRYAQMPFAFVDEDPANEWAVSLGLGLRLAADDLGPLAVGDIGLERGRRSGLGSSSNGALTETFWRFSASISLFGR